MQETIVYEQPLNERVRTLLRLEFLFGQIDAHLEGNSPWNSRTALSGILDVLNIFSRADLKTEILKELERLASVLTPLEQKSGVDQGRLSAVLNDLDGLIDRLHSLTGQVGQGLRQNEFLNSINKRSGIPGGTCDFDLPEYHFWLHYPRAQRVNDLQTWLREFEPVQHSVQLILELIRQSASAQQAHAPAGFYQQSLDPQSPCQMIQVGLPQNAPYFAEISGGRHRFTARFMTPNADGRAVQTDQEVEFELSCCVI